MDATYVIKRANKTVAKQGTFDVEQNGAFNIALDGLSSGNYTVELSVRTVKDFKERLPYLCDWRARLDQATLIQVMVADLEEAVEAARPLVEVLRELRQLRPLKYRGCQSNHEEKCGWYRVCNGGSV